MAPRRTRRSAADPGRPGWLHWVIVGLIVVIAAVSVWIVRHHRDTGSGPGAEDLGPAGSVTQLITADPPADASTGAAGAAGAGDCVSPTAMSVAANDLAFEGRVTAVDDDRVILEPEHWYRGSPSRRVTVRAEGGGTARVLDQVPFETGDRYLVAALDGRLSLCGVTALWTSERRALYVSAFGSRS